MYLISAPTAGTRRPAHDLMTSAIRAIREGLEGTGWDTAWRFGEPSPSHPMLNLMSASSLWASLLRLRLYARLSVSLRIKVVNLAS